MHTPLIESPSTGRVYPTGHGSKHYILIPSPASNRNRVKYSFRTAEQAQEEESGCLDHENFGVRFRI
jgi:hypothetical protein